MTLGGVYVILVPIKMKSTLTQGSDLFMSCRDHVKQGRGVYIENETFPGT